MAKHPRTGEFLCIVDRACSGIVWGLTEAQANALIECVRGTPVVLRPRVRFLGRHGRYVSRMGQPYLVNQAIVLQIGQDDPIRIWKNGLVELHEQAVA